MRLSPFVRGLRNAYRSKARAVLVTLVIGLSVGIAVTMVRVSAAAGEFLRTVASEYLVLLEVRRAGATGMGAGVEALPEAVFAKARAVPGVARVEKYLLTRTVDARRPSASVSMIVGVEPGATLRVAEHGELRRLRVLAGRLFGPQDCGRPVALVGKAYAQHYGLRVGSTFVLRADLVAVADRVTPDVALADAPVEVIGIFETGFLFGDYQVFLPLDVAQRIFRQEGRITHIYVTAASVDQVERVEGGLREVFGDQADVVSGQTVARAWGKALGALRANSLLAAAVAVGAGALVVLFTMMLVTRERTREIGILKAIGASNGVVVGQFVGETLAIALAGATVGFAIFGLAGEPLAGVLLGVIKTGLAPQTAARGENPLSVLDIAPDLSLSSLIGVLALAAGMAVLGSTYVATRALRVGPAEAMRHE